MDLCVHIYRSWTNLNCDELSKKDTGHVEQAVKEDTPIKAVQAGTDKEVKKKGKERKGKLPKVAGIVDLNKNNKRE